MIDRRIIREEYFHSSVAAYCHKDKSFLSSISSLIENLLKEYVSPFDSESLLDLINYLNDENLKGKLHEIRKKANEHKHSGTEIAFEPSDYYKYFEPINQLIDYLQRNYNSSIGFRYIRENLIFYEDVKNDAISNEVPISISQDFESDYTPFNRHTLKTFFSEDFLELPNTYNNDYVIIKGGYFSNEKCFGFIKPEITPDSKMENVIFKVIYNLLIRNSVIDIPENFKSKGFSYEQLNRIFYIQCLFTYVASNLNHKPIEVYCCQADYPIIEAALVDIREMYNHYFDLLDNVFSKQMIWPYISIKEDKDLDPNVYIINDEQFEIELFDSVDFTTNLYQIAVNRYNLHADDKNMKSWEYFARIIFGYDKLKIGQKNILEYALKSTTYGKIPCCILPTGYGKSAIYQLISFLMPKISFVISPTLILIRDQLNNLRDKIHNNMAKIMPNTLNYDGLESSALLFYSDANSLYSTEIKDSFDKLHRLNKIGYFNIDECHQISIWSQNFDFNYLTLTDFLLKNTPGEKVLMFTATANDKVQDDLMSRFQKSNKTVDFIIAGSFQRKGIEHKIIKTSDNQELLEQFKEQLLFYVNKALEDEANHMISFESIVVINNDPVFLNEAYQYIKNTPYGNGAFTLGDCSIMYNSNDMDTYSIFISGLKKVMFASDEFSIGINIPSVKTIITLGTPLSKEWFYQETGRVCRIANVEDGIDVKSNGQDVIGTSVEIFIDDNQFKMPITLDKLNYAREYKNCLYSNLYGSLNTFTKYEFDSNLMKNIYFNGNKIEKPYAMYSDYSQANKYSTGIYLCSVSGIIKEYTGNVYEENGINKIRYNMIYNNTYDNDKYVKSEIIKFTQLYETDADVTRKLGQAIKVLINPSRMLTHFVSWYYESLLYQIHQMFMNAQDMLINNNADQLEKVLELTFTAKIAGSGGDNYIIIGVGLDDQIKFSQFLNRLKNNKVDADIEKFKKFISYYNVNFKESDDLELITTLQELITTKNESIYNYIYGFFEFKNNYEPTRFMIAKQLMTKEEYHEYMKIIYEELEFNKNLKYEYIYSLIQCFNLNDLITKNIEISNNLKSQLLMIEIIKEFRMGR